MNRISSKVAQGAASESLRSTSKFPRRLNRASVVASVLLLGLSATPSQAVWNVYLEIPGADPASPKPNTVIQLVDKNIYRGTGTVEGPLNGTIVCKWFTPMTNVYGPAPQGTVLRLLVTSNANLINTIVAPGYDWSSVTVTDKQVYNGFGDAAVCVNVERNSYLSIGKNLIQRDASGQSEVRIPYNLKARVTATISAPLTMFRMEV